MGDLSRIILCGVVLSVMVTIIPVQSSYFGELITKMEKAFINKTSNNCTAVEIYLGLQTYQKNDIKPHPANLSLVLYTGNGSEKTSFRLTDPVSQLIDSPKFNKSLPLTVVIHGFYGTQKSNIVQQTTAALLERGGTNVLALDPGTLLKQFYPKSANNAMFIGKYLGLALADITNGGTKIHLIGHSLGAHIAGYAGKIFNITRTSKIARISGLDPAGPCFFSMKPTDRLCITDADFVDVMHTDAGVLGIIESIGHVDLYVNGGENQPGALMLPESHRRSWKIYAESVINSTSFPAVLCPNWDLFEAGLCSTNPKAYMGYDLPHIVRGVYYLRTADSPPFGMGDDGIKPEVPKLPSWWGSMMESFQKKFKN